MIDGFGVRPGHTVSIFFGNQRGEKATRPKGKSGSWLWYLYYYNHNTGLEYVLPDSLREITGQSSAVSVLVVLSWALLTGLVGIGIMIGISYFEEHVLSPTSHASYCHFCYEHQWVNWLPFLFVAVLLGYAIRKASPNTKREKDAILLLNKARETVKSL
ncbi:MAG: hypothetical protein HQK96_15855 [Nitrospirae bacterium]|nr:hypothetical protein [Nitrospirota bacterium]